MLLQHSEFILLWMVMHTSCLPYFHFYVNWPIRYNPECPGFAFLLSTVHDLDHETELSVYKRGSHVSQKVQGITQNIRGFTEKSFLFLYLFIFLKTEMLPCKVSHVTWSYLRLWSLFITYWQDGARFFDPHVFILILGKEMVKKLIHK